MSTFDPDALECLAAIVEEGGFERAAQRLSITQSAVSQRLRALEAQVGTVLIVRSRPLKPTSAGNLLLKHTKMLRLLRADLERDLKELAPSSLGGAREEERISIAINADSIATWALPALTALAQQGQLLLLDEPTSDLDLKHQLGTMQAVRSIADNKGLGAVIAIHDLSLAARFCDRLIMLRGGRIYAQGQWPSVLTPTGIEAVYGVNAKVGMDDGEPYVIASRKTKHHANH